MKTYILSGGKSSRMGTDKGLIHLSQKPMVTYLISTLKSLGLETSLIANSQDYLQFELPVIQDVYAEKGPLGGIFTALHDAQEDCLIISVDTPFIQKKHIDILVKEHEKNNLTLAFSAAKIYPIFGVYPFILKGDLENNLKNNQLKLTEFIQKNAYKKVEFNFSTLEKLNINTLEDLHNAEKLFYNEN